MIAIEFLLAKTCDTQNLLAYYRCASKKLYHYILYIYSKCI